VDTSGVNPDENRHRDEAFLDYLRNQLGTDALGFAVRPTRLTGGYDTTIRAFELGGAREPAWRQPLVARVFKPGERERPRREGAIHSAISEQGFPCPPALLTEESDEPLGGPFIIMPRLPGRPLLDFALSPTGWYRVPRLLARTQLALHALDAERVRERLAEHGFPLSAVGVEAWLSRARSDVQRDGLRQFEPALNWIEANAPEVSSPVVCHCDFHPLNLLAERWRVTGVIDWPNALFAEPELDVAFSRVIMTMGPIDAGALNSVVSGIRGGLTRLYEREYRKHRPLDTRKLRYYEALRCLFAMLNAARGRERGGQGFVDEYAWGKPRQVALMTGHFRAVTGVELPAP